MHPDACPCRLHRCGFPSLPWVALCVLCLGTMLGEIPGDPPDDTTEVFDSVELRALAYPAAVA